MIPKNQIKSKKPKQTKNDNTQWIGEMGSIYPGTLTPERIKESIHELNDIMQSLKEKGEYAVPKDNFFKFRVDDCTQSSIDMIRKLNTFSVKNLKGKDVSFTFQIWIGEKQVV